MYSSTAVIFTDGVSFGPQVLFAQHCSDIFGMGTVVLNLGCRAAHIHMGGRQRVRRATTLVIPHFVPCQPPNRSPSEKPRYIPAGRQNARSHDAIGWGSSKMSRWHHERAPHLSQF